ncbi:hypothetical protein [Flavobacterium sp.]|uniref:hypothetical protein n=1 Tax=Flavobacterium sp. TaxID=239 RepID=UPI00286C564D|nr:hypothetical protein [Flavobacterium sp.]
MKNIFQILLFLLIFQSCQYFEKNVPAKDDLVKKELNKINWDQVDEFPSASQCDSIIEKEERKNCFFSFLSQTIQQKLAIDSIKKLYPKIDSLSLKITVLPDSKLVFESQDTLNKSKIDSLLKIHFNDFPTVEPAIKRGMKVKSQFILPVILKKK